MPPGPRFLSTDDAAKRLGISKAQFRRVVGLDPGPRTLPGIQRWLRPSTAMGRDHLWDAEGIDCLAYILSRWQDEPGAAPPDEPAD